jgi:hypothetical protein
MIRYRLTLVLAAALAALLYLGAWRAADHAPGVLDAKAGLAVPLDDVAIYFQYARQALHGEWLRYSPGAGLSTGVTSPAYFVLLCAAMGLGLPGPWAAWLLGALSLLLSIALMDALSRRHFPALPPWWGPLLLLSHGAWVGWSFNGMETGLLLALVLWAAWAVCEAEARGMLAAAAALAFTRPEGQVLALLFGAAWCARREQWRWAPVLLALAAAPSLLVLGLSGGLIPDSVRAKSGLARAGGLSWDFLKQASSYGIGLVKGLWMGLWGGQDAVGLAGDLASGNPAAALYPPLLLLGALFGFFAGQARGERAFWRASAAGLASMAALLSCLMPLGWHVHRYQAAAAPLLWLGALAGLQALRETGGLGRHASAALFLLWASFGLASWPWHLQRDQQGAANYALFNRNAAVALRSFPPGSVAVVDAGLLAYYSGHPIADLAGITDHALSLSAVQGKGCLLEALLARPEAPRWAVLHPARQDFDPSAFEALGLLARRPQALPGGMLLYDWNWHDARRQATPASLPAGARVVAELNTARLDQEKAADYRADGESAQHSRILNLRLWPGGPQVPEGGREILRESFKQQGNGLILRAVFDQPGRLRILDPDGHNLMVGALDPSPAGCYSELYLPLPPGTPEQISLVFDGNNGQPAAWVSCHHWSVQKEEGR